jgi:hypothetical protein
VFVIAYPAYIREKARKLRVERKMSLDEIAECLAIPKTTVWHWIADLPKPPVRRRKPLKDNSRSEAARRNHRARTAAASTNREKALAIRQAAYFTGWDEFDALDAEPGFRDFVCMYIGEGTKSSRNTVAICNSDPRVVRLGNFWICRFAINPVTYSFQHHADQDPEYLVRFWSTYLAADPEAFRFQRKSNSGQLSGRKWRSRWGVLTVNANDTRLRARLQGWMDRVQDGWLDSIVNGA